MPMEKLAMVFDWEVRERDAGVYSCQASFYHHAATVSFLVEVTSEAKLLGERLRLYTGRQTSRGLKETFSLSLSISQGWRPRSESPQARPSSSSCLPSSGFAGESGSLDSLAGIRGQRCQNRKKKKLMREKQDV